MGRNGEKRQTNVVPIGRAKRNLDDDVDALFKVALAEFIGARNALAARLKQSGRVDDAQLVKALAKPSVSAWAVNQLYWNHREAFNELLAAGERFRQAQASSFAGKVADMRGALDARREALTQLSALASSLLGDAGHNPSPDTILRITRTLEAMSALASLADGATLGRLTRDVDPPGFESLASFVPSAGSTRGDQKPARSPALQKSGIVTTKARLPTPTRDVDHTKEVRRARIATAKASLQGAKKSLAEARVKVQRLEAAQKKAQVEVKEAEKQRREAEDRFKKARAVAEEVAQRARKIADEAREAAKMVDDAKRTIENISTDLESLLRDSPAS